MSTVGDAFFVTGGTLRHDAPSYVERKADRDLLDGLLRGAFCYVLTSRQMGKSSLMVRTAARLREQGVLVVVIDLTAIGQNVTPEQWYDGLLVRMAGQLKLEDELEEFWETHPRLSPVQRFFQGLQEVVLKGRGESLVVFVDEIDVVRSLPFSTDEFFAAIRELYNRRTEHDLMRRVSFCLLGVAAPGDLIRDTRMTPFNIGRRIELNDFTAEEALPLARGLVPGGTAKDDQARVTLARVFRWTNGHPYLTQRFCQALASLRAADPRTIDAACEELFLSNRARDQDDNLLFVRDRLLRGQTDPAGVLTLYGDALRGRPPVSDDVANPLVGTLHLSGIVRSEHGRLGVRNGIYARVFDRHWIDANMPDAELRRQRAAFYRGVIRTTAIAATVVVALTVAVLSALHQAAEARKALAQSDFSQAQTRRVSGVAGQRYESLEALRRARPGFANDAVLRDEAIACLALPDLKLVLVRTNFPPGATAVCLSPGLDYYAIGEASGTLVVRRTVDDQVTALLNPTDRPVAWLALSPDGRFLASQHSGDGRHQFAVWELATSRAVVEGTNLVHPGAIDFSADGTRLALVLEPGQLDVITLPTGRRVAQLPLRQVTNTPRDPSCVRFDASGRRLAESGPGSQRAQIWNIADASVTNRFLPSEISALAWSPDGLHLAAAGNAGLALWDLQSDRSHQLAQSQAEAIQDLAFSPDGTRLASVDANRSLRLWCPATARQVTEPLPAGATGRILFSSDGRRLGLAGLTTGVRLWQVQGGEEYRVFRVSTEFYAPINCLAFDPEGRVLMGASDMGAFFWDTETGRALPTLAQHSIRSLCVDPKKGDLYASGPEGLFRRERRVTQGPAGVEFHFGKPRSFELPGGLESCSLGSDGKQSVVVHGRHLHWLQTDEANTTAVLPFWGDWKTLALSPDGKWLAIWDESEKQIQVRSMQNPGAAERPATRIPAGRHFAFTPDSRFLLTGHAHSNLLWSTETWTAPTPFDTLSREANAPVAFGRRAGDGRTLFAITDETGLIKLYELTGATNTVPAFRLLARLEDPDRKPVAELVFNPQGSRLAAATKVQTVQVWDLAQVRRGLDGLGLAGDLPEFTAGAAVPLAITFDPALSHDSRPGFWLQVEGLTFDLANATAADATVRAKQLVERGTLYLNRLDRPTLAKADFEEALRLQPGDAKIIALQDQAGKRLKAPPPGNP